MYVPLFQDGLLIVAFLDTKNTGPDAEVFRPEAYPAGYITATVSRKGSKL